MPITETSNSPSSSILYKSSPDTIKSTWKATFWERKQVRILVGPNAELSIQAVAQNSFARLASVFLKFISFGKIKSFGKKIISLTTAGLTLPSNFSVSLTPSQETKLFEIQNLRLTQLFLPSHKNLNDLGVSLCDQAIKAEGNQAVREKVLDMHQEILNFQLTLHDELQRDIAPAVLYEKFKTFEKESEKICKEYPGILTQFIAETQASEKLKLLSQSEPEEIKNEEKKEEGVSLQSLQTTVENPLLPPSTSHLMPQQKYEILLKFAQESVENLRKHFQFVSADRLEKETGKIKNNLEIENIRVLFSKNKKEVLYKAAAEALEDVLDILENSVQDPIEQLAALKKLSSPYYNVLRSFLVNRGSEQLNDYISTLEDHQNIVQWGFSNLPEKKIELEAIQVKINEKLLEAKSLTADYFVRLHFWHLFESKIPVKELLPDDLKNYLNKINFLSKNGILEVKQFALEFGLEF